MIPALIAAAATVVVAVIAAVSQRKPTRSDLDLAHQEADLLRKLEAGSQSATELESLITKRIEDWRKRYEAPPNVIVLVIALCSLSLVCLEIAAVLFFYLSPEPFRQDLNVVSWALLGYGLIAFATAAVIQSRWNRLYKKRRLRPEIGSAEPPKPSAAHLPNSQHPAVDATSTSRTT
jgi:hypothetical protein